jgi:hypothetical protein
MTSLMRLSGLCWPDFGRIAALNAVVYCASLSSISAAQQAYELVTAVPADLYGSDDLDTDSMPGRIMQGSLDTYEDDGDRR